MKKTAIVPAEIVTADASGNILEGYAVVINGDIIESIIPVNDLTDFEGEIVKDEGLTLIPGFIQTHIHLCQTMFRGLADDLQLLDWLQYKIFPYENAHNENSMSISVRLGLNELIGCGTTTILDMGSLRHQEIIFEELIKSGIRAFAGKCMMDSNDLLPKFKSSLKEELGYTYKLAKEYHNGTGRVKYAFAPRFLLTSSEKLLRDTREMMKDFPGSLFHTHASENKTECEIIRKKYSKDNIEYFDSINVLDERSVLAHCIHISETEMGILKKTNTAVAHCPSSNLKLGSGIAPVPKMLEEKIRVSLGADGAPCNNRLSIFNEMRLASLIQKPIYGPTILDAETIFRLATIEGARALNIERLTGSIEAGKKADLVLLNLRKPYLPLNLNKEDIYSRIVYSAADDSVEYVMTDGAWAVKKKNNLLYDSDELYNSGSAELNKLLKRAG